MSGSALKSAIDSYVAAHRIDPDRIYIEGMSMGGTGVWNMILAYPYYFAAAIPMCGMVPAQWYNVPAPLRPSRTPLSGPTTARMTPRCPRLRPPRLCRP